MRSKYAIINSLYGILIFGVTGILGFINRGIMMPILGSEVVGLLSIFGDVLMFLNITDLGMTAIISSVLYKPIYNRDSEKIKGILDYYKKIYRILGLIFCIGSIILSIILYFYIDTTVVDSIEVPILFILFVSKTAIAFYFSHRLVLINADQKVFKLKLVSLISNIILAIFRIVILKVYMSIYLYLFIDTIVTLGYYLLMNKIIIKYYYDDVEKCKSKIDNETKSRITKMINGILFNKIGIFIMNGTNSIYAGLFEGLSGAAILNNYMLIVNIIRGIIDSLYNGIMSTIGNVLVEKNENDIYGVFKNILFIHMMLISCLAIGFNNSVTDFIKVWIGEEYLLSNQTVIIISIYIFVSGMRPVTEKFKVAAGIYYEDRYIYIIESVINVVSCIYFGKKFGITGIMVGNLLTCILIGALQKPYMSFKYVFKQPLILYVKEIVPYLIVFFVSGILSNSLCNSLIINNHINGFIVKGTISVSVTIILHCIIFWRTSQCKYTRMLVSRILNKLKIKSELNYMN